MTTSVHVERNRSAFPLHRSADDAAFTAARAALIDARYTEPAICERTGIPSIYEFRRLHEGRTRSELGDALDVLLRLFLDTEAVGGEALRRLLPVGTVDALVTLGLLARAEDGEWRATALLYPTRSLFVASDLDHPTAQGRVADDAVYPAITSNTQTFLDSLPWTRCERFLEMCGGTGIAALAAASHGAGRAWTADITERATWFAEFNARLNALDTVRAVCGDLWEPVRGLTFDRIVAHPPYVAEAERTLIFRDGGPDGELITRGLLAGLTEFLEPGGRFYCTCIATDRAGAPLERRVREMLGDEEDEFDVVVVERSGFHPSEYYCRMAAGAKMPFTEAEQRHLAYKALGVTRMVYCTIVVQRHAMARAPFTLRKASGRAREGDALEWLLAWETANAERDLTGALLDARPIAAPALRLRTEQHLFEGAWRVHGCALRTEAPFEETTDCSLDAAAFLARCDGSLTLREHAERLAAEGLLDPRAGAGLVELVRGLVGTGCLDLDIFRAPR